MDIVDELIEKKIKCERTEKTLYEQAIFIRCFESKLLELFSRGYIGGTIHTCIGQEYIAIAFAAQLKEHDFVFSNHRSHGHFIAFTKAPLILAAEILGKKTGCCGGIGGSQHLYKKNFFSNGIQGGMLPIAAGICLANKLNQENSVVVIFIGDGTLGQGIVYETLNIIAKWQIPLLVVCENNGYAQSTKIEDNLSGSILSRAKAFDIEVFESHAYKFDRLMDEAANSIEYVKKYKKPVFHLVHTTRLGPHSKGDENREAKEIEKNWEIDPITIFKKNNAKLYSEIHDDCCSKVNTIFAEAMQQDEMFMYDYIEQQQQQQDNTIDIKWSNVDFGDKRIADLINDFFKSAMHNKEILFIGEDVKSPYGGAFKIAKDLSDLFPEQVFSMPISEAAIVGISNGLALAGKRPFVEIMFGDFVTLCLDQIINHAYKFNKIYNKQVTCPIVVRMPVGGGRGYGPTHSQSLHRLLTGFYGTKIIALNSYVNPKLIYNNILKLTNEEPIVVVENKLDYSRINTQCNIQGYVTKQSIRDFPVIHIQPPNITPSITILTYGGTCHTIFNIIEAIFVKYEVVVDVLFLSQLYPLNDIDIIINSVEKTKKLLVVEEDNTFCSIGSEIIYQVKQKLNNIKSEKIALSGYPIPANSTLELNILPNDKMILDTIGKLL